MVLVLLSIQKVCGVGMSSEMCGVRFSGAVSQNLLADCPSAVPAQLEGWSAVTWISMRKAEV